MSNLPDRGIWWMYYMVLPVVSGAVKDVIAALPEYEKRKRGGGYFCLCEVGVGSPPILIALVGEVPVSKRMKYFRLAQDKVEQMPASPWYHVSSWLSRDPDKGRWGGCIKAGNYYLAFSGLPELADEAAMLLAAVRLNLLGEEDARAIARLSYNQIYLGKEWLVAHRTT